MSEPTPVSKWTLSHTLTLIGTLTFLWLSSLGAVLTYGKGDGDVRGSVNAMSARVDVLVSKFDKMADVDVRIRQLEIEATRSRLEGNERDSAQDALTARALDAIAGLRERVAVQERTQTLPMPGAPRR